MLAQSDKLFDQSGAAAHLAQASRVSFRDAFARLMAFVSERHRALLARPASEWLNHRIIQDYITWQPASTGPCALANTICFLGLMVRYMYPEHDWAWLLMISARLRARARRQRRGRPVVTSECLYALGLGLMESAVPDEMAGASPVSVALQYRDGLIIALLAAIPLRRRTLAALRIGRHVVQTGETWALDLPAELLKNKRPIEYSIPAELSQRVDIYVRDFRGRIKGSQTHEAMWPSELGRPMSYYRIYTIIKRRTEVEFGFPVTPHLFRMAAGTLWSMRDPQNVRGVRDLLGHSSFATTEQFYIKAQSRHAGRVLVRAVDAVRDTS